MRAWLWWGLVGCGVEPEPEAAACVAGAWAGVVTADLALPEGDDVLAAPGDVVLRNDRVAMVIQDPASPRTWYDYGGVPVDFWPVDDCQPVGPDRFYEMGFIVGRLNIGDVTSSVLRMFRGELMRVVADGSDGGDAVVEVDGVDDVFWLVELELVKQAFVGGGQRAVSGPMGVSLTARYTLSPGSDAVRVDLIASADVPVEGGLFMGSFHIGSDHATPTAWRSGRLELGGFGFDIGGPWLGLGDGASSYAVSMPGARLARLEQSGTSTLVDVAQALEPLAVGPGLERQTTWWVGLGRDQGVSAVAAVIDADPMGMTSFVIDGLVMDDLGRPGDGALVVVQRPDDQGNWLTWTTLRAAMDGTFSGRLSAADDRPWRVRAEREGVDPSPWWELVPGEGAGLALEPLAGGRVEVVATDRDGPVAVRLELERDDGLVVVRWPVPGDRWVDVPPGTWSVWASRGFEHEIATASVTVEPGMSTTLALDLPRLLDTSGWASIDTHVHASASPDSSTLNPLRARTVAAAGLDAAVITDHEAISHLSDEGLGVVLLAGSEVTATLPEHTNAWPFPVQEGPRGNAVDWRGHSLGGIYQAERARGARVVQLNHARVNRSCGILCLLDWDRLTGLPRMTDPSRLALPLDEPLWSWDFDSFEVLNGNRSPFVDPESPTNTGAFEDWLAFLNLGHRVTPVAVTDVHGVQIPGSPRTWLAVPDDRPGRVTEDDLVAGMLGGAAVVSAGAFARVDVGGVGPGGVAPGGEPLRVRVEALPGIDVAWVEVLANCDELVTIDTTEPDGVVKLDVSVPLVLGQDAHIVVVGFGTGSIPRGLTDYPATVPRFFTAAIYVDVDGNGRFDEPGGKACDFRPTR